LQPLDTDRVKEWRHRRMLSQQELANSAGTSLFTIQRIERGEGNVRPKTGRGVAAALGVSIEELLPIAQAPLFQEQPEHEPPKQRRRDAYELALDASKRQALQDSQGARRALASEGRPQTYFKRHENKAVMELSKYPADELADALLKATGRLVEERGLTRVIKKKREEKKREEAAEKVRSETA
jgi:transcriptional regulator with XRE-family HTH domain